MSKNLPAEQKSKLFLEKLKSKSVKNAVKADKSKLESAIAITPKLLFSMDATASRQHSWEIAQQITSSMFDVMPGGLKIALAHHGGGILREVTEYRTDALWFKEKILSVQCTAGETALCEILANAANTRDLKSIIYIGDCFEEDESKAIELARTLAQKCVQCFMFIEGDNEQAFSVFREIAKITKGAVFPFETASTGKVKEKLDAIAAYTVGGRKLLLSKQTSLLGAKDLLALLD